MREATIEKAVCEWAREHGLIVVKLSGPNAKGQPDRMFLSKGNAVFVEFKAPKKRPTKLQEKWLGDLLFEGFDAAWFDNAPAAIKWLKKVFKI